MKKVKGKRIAAAIIDKIISFLIIFILSSITIPVISRIIYQIYNNYYYFNDIYILLSISIISLIILFIYYTVIPHLTKGATIGKTILKIKVVSTNFQTPTFSQYLKRNIFFFKIILFYIIPVLYLLIFKKTDNNTYYVFYSHFIIFFIINIISNIVDIIIFFMIIFTDEERGFHDLIGKTYVIDKNYSTNPLDNINALEIEQMDWAIFTDNKAIPQNNNKDEDEIEILKRIK